MTSVTVVVPLYSCSSNIYELARRLDAVFRRLHTSHRVFFVDDGSPDDEWKKIVLCVKKYPSLTGIQLKRNMGQQTAIAIGLSFSKSPWTIVMDGDLQDRPEDIPLLLAAAKKNHTVVIARRSLRHVSFSYAVFSWWYHFVISIISQKVSDVSLGNFTVLDEKTLRLLQKTDSVCLSYLQAVRRIAKNVTCIDVIHDTCASRKSSYTYAKLIRLALVTFTCWLKPIHFSRSLISYNTYVKDIRT